MFMFNKNMKAVNLKKVIKYSKALLSINTLRAKILMFLIFLSASIEGIGILMIIPLLSKGIPLGYAVAFYLLLVSFHSALVYFRQLLETKHRIETTSYFRKKIHSASLFSSWNNFNQLDSSKVSKIATIDTSAVGYSVSFIFQLIVSIVLLFAYLLVSFSVSVASTFLAAAFGFLILLALRKKSNLSYSKSQNYSDSENHLFRLLSDLFLGMKSLRALGAEDLEKDRFNSTNSKCENAEFFALRTSAELSFFSKIVGALSISILIIFYSEFLKLNLTQIAVLTGVLARAIPKFIGAQKAYNQLLFALPRYESIYSLLISLGQNKSSKLKTVNIKNEIAFDNVSYKYPGQDNFVLNELSFAFKLGKIIGIEGISGAGKTTLVDILAGFLRPSSGSVFIDKKPVSGVSHSWVKDISYVDQKPFIFFDSISENLKWAKDGVSKNEISQILNIVALEQYENRLGYLGPRCSQMSVGERQRLTLAISILKQPKVLILDEAFSNLDYNTRERIVVSLKKNLKNTAIILVSHQQSVIEHADMVLSVDKYFSNLSTKIAANI